jgi:opacity protein-like surface antigen
MGKETMMKAMWKKVTFALASLVLFSYAASAQTDVALSLYGAFGQSTSGNNTVQSPANSAGGMLEVRHIRNPLVGYEGTYAYNRDNQGYSSVASVCPGAGTSCNVSTASISANAHQVTGDWIISLKVANLKPFALAGGGLLLNVPTGGTVTTTSCGLLNPLCQQTTTAASTTTSTKGVFVYGAGVDWTILPHLGLRFQYRGNLYKASDMANAFSSTNAFTHNSQPMIGIFFRL